MERAAYVYLSSIYRATARTLAGIQTVDDLEAMGSLYHITGILEHILEAMRIGNLDERRQALVDARKWGA